MPRSVVTTGRFQIVEAFDVASSQPSVGSVSDAAAPSR